MLAMLVNVLVQSACGLEEADADSECEDRPNSALMCSLDAETKKPPKPQLVAAINKLSSDLSVVLSQVAREPRFGHPELH